MARDVSQYVVDGARWPSVTEILALAGLSSLGRVPEHYLEAARERGHDLHEWLDGVDTGLLDADLDPPQAIAPYVAAYRRFLAETGWKTIQSETRVQHDALRYVGTYDRLGLLPGMDRPIVADLKATAAIYPETRLQVAGYALAVAAQDGSAKPGRAALQLRPDGTYRWDRYTDRSDEYDWIAAVRVAHFRLSHRLASLEDLR